MGTDKYVIPLGEMEVTLDPDVKKVLEFMQTNIPCSKLVAVANSIKELATPLWGNYKGEQITPLFLRHPEIVSDVVSDVGQPQSIST